MLIVNMKRFILVFTVNIALMLGFRVQAQEYVDLGLSVNWATYNVGANNIEELGEKFVAGTTIKWQKGRAKTHAVIHINGFSGNAEYDAVTANWGQGWRTPARAEWEELIRRCKWKHSKLVLSNGTKIYCYLIDADSIYNVVEIKTPTTIILSLDEYNKIYYLNGLIGIIIMPFIFMICCVGGVSHLIVYLKKDKLTIK